MDINTIIADYIRAKQEESSAKKAAAAAKEMILQHANGADNFMTDVYTVIIKKTQSVRLDTETLYKDFPDIKREYSKVTESTSLDVVKTAGPAKKTA